MSPSRIYAPSAGIYVPSSRICAPCPLFMFTPCLWARVPYLCPPSCIYVCPPSRIYAPRPVFMCPRPVLMSPRLVFISPRPIFMFPVQHLCARVSYLCPPVPYSPGRDRGRFYRTKLSNIITNTIQPYNTLPGYVSSLFAPCDTIFAGRAKPHACW